MSVSHKESTVPSAELKGSDTGQLGPTNSTGVSNRSYPHPHQSHISPPIDLSQDKHMVTRKVQELLSKGAVVESIPPSMNFVSQIFLVEKRGGQ